MFCFHENVNDIWEKIKNLTEIGLLGEESKVSTRKHSKKYNNNEFVICAYTENYRNKADVKRVLKEIRKVGVNGRLFYKPDNMTVKGIYHSKSTKSNLYCSDKLEQDA